VCVCVGVGVGVGVCVCVGVGVCVLRIHMDQHEIHPVYFGKICPSPIYLSKFIKFHVLDICK
jgi:hypothetical protein